MYRSQRIAHSKMLIPILLVLALVMSACSQPNSVDSVPTGDANQGAALFTQSINGSPACSSCHTLDGETLVGPSFQGFGKIAETRQIGSTAQEYIRTSIVQPSDYIVAGFSNLMYSQYGQHLSPQQMADLIAYLLTL